MYQSLARMCICVMRYKNRWRLASAAMPTVIHLAHLDCQLHLHLIQPRCETSNPQHSSILPYEGDTREAQGAEVSGEN